MNTMHEVFVKELLSLEREEVGRRFQVSEKNLLSRVSDVTEISTHSTFTTVRRPASFSLQPLLHKTFTLLAVAHKTRILLKKLP